MLKYISADWKTDLQTYPSNERFYIDFRMLEYPNILGTPVYTLITDADNQPGTYTMTDGYSTHLITMAETFTLDIWAYADFDFNVAADQYLYRWALSATEYLTLYYDATADKITVAYKNGTNERLLISAAYAAGLNDWLRITLVFDITSPLLYIDGVLADDAWSAAADAWTATFTQFDMRLGAAAEGEWHINYIRLFQNYMADATAIGNNFKDVPNEEIFFDLDGNQVGKTRCNVTRFVKAWNYNAAAENAGGSQVANRASMMLYSLNGEFADDQYAAYDPVTDVFNGTLAQKYLQQRCRVEIETWYGGLFEPIIRGYIDEGYFSRHTQGSYWSEVTIGIEDYVTLLANAYKDRTTAFEDFYLSSTTKNSLFHEVARLATNKKYTNYLCDSGFEDTETPVDAMENGTCEDGTQVGPTGILFKGPCIRGFNDGGFLAIPASFVGIAAHAGTKIAMQGIGVQVGEIGTARSKKTLLHSPGVNLRGLQAGVEYTLKAWVYNPAVAGMTTVTLSMYDDVTGATNASTVVTGAWTELSVTHTINAAATNVECYLTGAVTAMTAYAQYYYIDDVSLRPSALNSWTEAGAITATRDDTYAHTGSRSGKLVFAAAGSISQTLMFEQPLFCNVGDVYTAVVYALSAAGFTGTLRLAEWDSVAINDSTTVAIVLAGGEGWVRYEVQHTITDADSDRLVYGIEGDADTVWIDTAQLISGEASSGVYAINGGDGEAGITRPQYSKSFTYDFIGINADVTDVQHPYAVIAKNENIWEHLKQIADACGARYMGMDNAGVLTMKTHLVAVDPTPIETVEVPSSVATQLQSQTANKIVISGVIVSKNVAEELYWQASACDEFKQYPYIDKEGKFSYNLSTTRYFPQNGDYIIIKYGETQ